MSSIKLFGATYSAAAVSKADEIKPEITGRFIMLGIARDMATTDGLMCGKPRNVKSVVLMLPRYSASCKPV
jgi:hypothetical protein